MSLKQKAKQTKSYKASRKQIQLNNKVKKLLQTNKKNF